MALRTFVFDLDGVVYRGKQPLPGAVETIESLRRLGHQVYFFTNNSTKTRAAYVHVLRDMGIQVDEQHIMTSSYATALYLQGKNAGGKSVLVVGEEGIRAELSAVGLRIVENGLTERADYVVAGMDREFTYNKLLKAQQAIFKGAEFIATNRDSTFPCEDGVVVPGGGAIVSAIEVASGVRAITIGKPETASMTTVLELARAEPQDTVIVGDRLETDIFSGKQIGATTVLVLTGITKRADLETAPPEFQPDIVVDTLPEMPALLGLDL